MDKNSKRLLIALAFIFGPFLCSPAGAQNIKDGSKWWTGSVLYKAEVRYGGVVYFQGSDDSELTIDPVEGKRGEYKIIASRQAEETPPVRGEFGWRVNYIQQEGMNFLVVRKPNGDAVETLVLTPDNLKDLEGQEAWAEQQPVSDIITGMLLNTTYLGQFAKPQLRLMRNEILARHGWKFQSQDLKDFFEPQPWYKPVADNNSIRLSIVEQTNLQMIKSEEAVPDDQRAYQPKPEDFPGGLADDGRGPDEIDGEQVYTVTNEADFIANLRPGRTVYIADNVHLNLSRILENEKEFINRPGRRWASDASAIVSKEPLVVSESETDGRQLALVNMSELTITGGKNASIEVDPRYSYCLYFINCDHCEVRNLTIGHTELGTCSGGVIGVKGGRQNVVADCDLYGCGTYGLDLMETTDFGLLTSNIHDCTYGIIQMRSCMAVRFSNCDFFNNREYDLIEGRGCEGVSFMDCRIFANWSDAPLFNLDNEFYMAGCLIYHPTEKLGTINRADQSGAKNWFSENPLDTNIKPRGIGPK